jgi:uncharacterized protein YdeI (YjbR/CyaY-like superfamily)
MNSPKSIVEKLSLEKYPTKLILNKPDDVSDFDETEYDTSINQKEYDLIFAFVFNLEDFAKYIQLVTDKQLLRYKGYLYFAYPKKGNPQYDVYIDRDSIFKQIPMDAERYVQESDIKFSKMASLNEVYTVVGFKSEKRKKAKGAKNLTKTSQCVDDYIENIEDIKQFLGKNKEIQDKYMSLTFGYQKDWARYVYSAKKKETQVRRLQEMEVVLSKGYKSIDLFKRDQK